MRDHTKYKTMHVPKEIHARVKRLSKAKKVTMIAFIDAMTRTYDSFEKHWGEKIE